MFLEISSSTYQLLDVLRHKGPIDATAAVAEIAATIAAAEHPLSFRVVGTCWPTWHNGP